MTGIYYFSSTGNGLQIAKTIRERFAGEILYAPKHIESGEKYERIFIVSPIYSFGLPIPTGELLRALDKSVPIYAVLHYGGMVGGADKLFCKYARELGLNLQGVYTVKMPENFTLYFTPPRFLIEAALKSMPRRVDKILDRVSGGKARLPKAGGAHEKTYLKNKSNWHLLSKRFSVSESCVKCGKCAEICPSGNISAEGGKVTFGDKCIACLGCYHRCPQKAIVYGKHRKKFRYTNPFIEEGEIGKDFI